MIQTNLEGYKITYFIENMLRDYVANYSSLHDIPQNVKDDAAKNKGLDNASGFPDLRSLLQWTHLGTLYDYCKSASFQKLKKNNLRTIFNIGPLIRLRDGIMHVRPMSYSELDLIRQLASNFVSALNDNRCQSEWEKFINDEIEHYSVPIPYIEYPIGKNFSSLIGRRAEMNNLKQWVKRPFPVSVVGVGGLGKSALVLQLIEDLIYSPDRPFETIYFMSFKDSAFENGTVKRFEKVIRNHKDLIVRLAEIMEIDPDNDTEHHVWDRIFSERSLLVLDNLETEITRSNNLEFQNIAKRFIDNYVLPSRLIITSRFGLGDNESKLPLSAFTLDNTKQLVSHHLENQPEKLESLSSDDWEWIQEHTAGNPGYIVSFTNAFRVTPESMQTIRYGYDVKYRSVSARIRKEREKFLDFCFENTIQSLSEESREYLFIISSICWECNINEISTMFLDYIIDVLDLRTELDEEHLHPDIFVNLGVFTSVLDDYKYYVDGMLVEYLNSDSSTLASEMHRWKARWAERLDYIVVTIRDWTLNSDLTLDQLVAKLFLRRFADTKDDDYLRMAFLSTPTIEVLTQLARMAKPVEVYSSVHMIEKLDRKEIMSDSAEAQNAQNQLIVAILQAMREVYFRIRNQEITNIRQDDLYESFKMMERNINVLKKNTLASSARKKVCQFLLTINKLSHAEKYLTDEPYLISERFKLASKQLGQDLELTRRLQYLEICESLLPKISDTIMRATFYISAARYYLRKTDWKQANKMATELDTLLDRTNPSLYSIYLESLIVRAEAARGMGNRPDLSKYLNKFGKEQVSREYKNVFGLKKEKFTASIQRLEHYLSS